MAVKFGVFVPQGWKMDLVEIEDPVEQYEAMTQVAKVADELPGVDSIWVYDHFHTVPTPTMETTFECWTITAGMDVHLLADGEDPAKAADWTGGVMGIKQYQRQFRVGNADQISAKIQAAVDAGANYIIVYLPRLAYDQDMLRRFAETVIPRLV